MGSDKEKKPFVCLFELKGQVLFLDMLFITDFWESFIAFNE